MQSVCHQQQPKRVIVRLSVNPKSNGKVAVIRDTLAWQKVMIAKTNSTEANENGKIKEGHVWVQPPKMWALSVGLIKWTSFRYLSWQLANVCKRTNLHERHLSIMFLTIFWKCTTVKIKLKYACCKNITWNWSKNRKGWHSVVKHKLLKWTVKVH